MNITIVSVGPVTLLAQVDVSNPQDSEREAIVVVDRHTNYEQYVVWRVVEETVLEGGVPVTRLHAFNGQYYSDLSAALGRFVRRSELLDRCDKEVV